MQFYIAIVVLIAIVTPQAPYTDPDIEVVTTRAPEFRRLDQLEPKHQKASEKEKLEVAPKPVTKPTARNASTGDYVLDSINKQRTQRGLSALRADSRLNASAYNKCQDMVKHDYWAHDNPNGTEWQSFIGFSYSRVGEILARYWSDSSVTQAWMNSPTHRQEILRAEYTHFGIGRCGDIIAVHFVR